LLIQAMSAMTSEPKVCDKVVETGLHGDIVANLDTVNPETLSDPQSSIHNSVQTQLNTLHNVVRRAHSARAAFRRCDAVDVIQKLRNVTEEQVTVLSYSTTVLVSRAYLSVGLRPWNLPWKRVIMSLHQGSRSTQAYTQKNITDASIHSVHLAQYKTVRIKVVKWDLEMK